MNRDLGAWLEPTLCTALRALHARDLITGQRRRFASYALLIWLLWSWLPEPTLPIHATSLSILILGFSRHPALRLLPPKRGPDLLTRTWDECVRPYRPYLPLKTTLCALLVVTLTFAIVQVPRIHSKRLSSSFFSIYQFSMKYQHKVNARVRKQESYVVVSSPVGTSHCKL
jgi:hypothetical protein